jgi:hypothetical protein
MEALLAIAYLCAVFSGSPFVSLREADKYQLSCQQDYIKCYEKKLAEDVPQSQDPKVWQGKLKSCVAERRVK